MLEVYKDVKFMINSIMVNMRDMLGYFGVRVGVEMIEFFKFYRVSK